MIQVQMRCTTETEMEPSSCQSLKIKNFEVGTVVQQDITLESSLGGSDSAAT